jgi:HSP20 family molecular chaperone IbpA
MRKRQLKYPIDFFYEDEYEWILNEMESIIDDIHFIEFLQKVLSHIIAVNKQSIFESNLNNLPRWISKVEENNPQFLKTGNKELKSTIEDEEFIDIFERDQDIAVTVELPGVEKKDIDLYLTEDTLEITVDSHVLNYYKMIELPCYVDVKTGKATYKNGVLDVVIKK